MAINSVQLGGFAIPGRTRRRRGLATGILVLVATWALAASPLRERAHSQRWGTIDHQVLPARGPDEESSSAPGPRPVPARSASASASASKAPRVATVVPRPLTPAAPASGHDPGGAAGQEESAAEAIARARKAIADCQARYREVRDYTCTFVKRERIDGRLTRTHIMSMKARTSPNSLYFKFHQPNRGREAIYVQGRYNGRIVAHDVGLGKFLAGTMHLDPRGAMAMEENRHPVTEAGLGSLIDTVVRHWAVELTPGESVVTVQPDARHENHACTLIETVHPQRGPNFLFHKVRLYVDHAHGLPIHFEAYDWPRHPGAAPDLVEEYSYRDLKTNVGLHERDFDPSNEQYSYGRF